MISIPPTDTLVPRIHSVASGHQLYYFPSDTELVKIDLLSEAGSAYQQQPLVAAAANKLFAVAGSRMDAEQLSEFFDFRGIIVESNNSTLQSATTFYTLSRHLDALLPVLDDLVHAPTFPEREFDIYRRERKQKIMASQQKTSDMARRLFYEAIFGRNHPLGCYATPEDAENLSLDSVKQHYVDYYRAETLDIVLAGHVDDRLLGAMEKLSAGVAGMPPAKNKRINTLNYETQHAASQQEKRYDFSIPSSVQSTIRVGRILSLRWDDLDYARMMLLVTILGGYFGSRLMSNLREDKGYTYGIYARTQIYRGVIVFYITADVAGSAADDAEKEIMHELQRLVDEPVSDEELDLVRTVLAGDFLRSVDGIFERSARFCDMLGTDITEQLTDNLRTALNETTAVQLQELAQRLMKPSDMIVCRAGVL